MLARIAGGLLILLGILAFLPNPLIGVSGMFRTDIYLNAILMALGLMLLAFTTKGEATAATGLYFTGMAGFALAMVGYVYLSDYPSGGVVKLFDRVSCNQEDVWLLAGIAGVLTVCGMMNTSSRQIVRD